MTSWSIIFLNAVRDCEVSHEFRTKFMLDFMLKKVAVGRQCRYFLVLRPLTKMSVS